MLRCVPVCLLLLAMSCCWDSVCSPTRADDPVFSGPQVGEKLPPFKALGALGDEAGKEIDLISQSQDKAVLLIFVHELTRPAFGLTNAMTKYAATRRKDGLISGVVFLTEDPTATGKWMNNVQKNFTKDVFHGLSPDGIEGPGAYGLNRNVTLTVLVGKSGKVTANFALVQPGVQADGPKILDAIVEVAGGKAPSIAELAGERYMSRNRPTNGNRGAAQRDPELTSRLRAVINKQASPNDVEQAVAEVEKLIKDKPALQQQLGDIASTVVNSGRLSAYGTAPAQEAIQRWSDKYGKKPESSERKARRE